jgi:MGT family glycosyltransferase
MSKHFLFVTDPSDGHINPVLPLVHELARRGHRIGFGTSDRFADVVAAAGAKPIVLPWREPPRPTNPEVSAADMADMQDHVLADTETSYPILDAYCEQDAPDAVCFDFVSFVGRVLAHSRPWGKVALFPTYAGNEHFSLTSIFVSDTFEYTHPRLIDLDRRMRAFAAERGATIDPNPLAEVLAPLSIVFIPREFHIAGETFDDRFLFVGPSVRAWERAAWEPPAGDRPLVFVSLGTGFNDKPEFFRSCIDAFAGTDWHVVIALGDKVRPADLGDLGPNVEVAPYFPQQAVLPYTNVFVQHLGMGSAMDALYFGVPIVAVPRMPESRVTGNRVEELNLGKVLDIDQATPRSIADTVLSVAGDKSISASMAEMKLLTRKAGGAVAAADAIEAGLAEGWTP